METTQTVFDFVRSWCAFQHGLNKLRDISSSFRVIWRNVSKCAENFQKMYIKSHCLWTKILISTHLYKDSMPSFNALSHGTKRIPKNTIFFWVMSERMSKNVRKSMFTKMATILTLIEKKGSKIDTTILKPVTLLCERFKLLSSNRFEK